MGRRTLFKNKVIDWLIVRYFLYITSIPIFIHLTCKVQIINMYLQEDWKAQDPDQLAS